MMLEFFLRGRNVAHKHFEQHDSSKNAQHYYENVG